MRIEELDYDLPADRIAQEPLAERDASQLMLLDVPSGAIDSRTFAELPQLLPPSLIVFNDTRVFPARLHGHKSTGGKVELLLLRQTAPGSAAWLAMGRASKPIRPDTKLTLHDGEVQARVVRTLEDGQLEVDFGAARDVDQLLQRIGEVPLPPYIRRSPVEGDRARYQTVYARQTGAVAAPTAGLHFTKRLISALAAAGHETAFVTLHVGPGTFRPVQADTLDGHRMHEEAYEVPQATAEAVARAHTDGRAVVAIGTTVVRTLESVAEADGSVRSGAGSTRLFIKPPHRFRVVDHLVTNFHLPRSTLLALVMAFGGVDLIGRGYREAIETGYRFYSYGDAMLIRGAQQ